MRKINALFVISVLLMSILSSPVFFSSIALSQENTTTGSSGTSAPAETTATTSTTPTETTASSTTETTKTASTIEPITTETVPVGEPSLQPPTVTACPAPSQPPVCGENQGLKTRFDDKGCVAGYECGGISESVGMACPEIPASRITCGPNEQLNKVVDDKGCLTGFNCIPTETSGTSTCPQTVQEKPSCPEGSVTPVFDKGCLVSYACVPQGCRHETDSSGFARVQCSQERVCPNEEQAKIKSQCFEKGGNPIAFHDSSGCQLFDCRFDTRELHTNPIGGYQSCPSGEEEKKQIDQCRNSGLVPNIAFEGGCKIVKCSKESEPVCRYVSESDKARTENECSSRGLAVVRDVDRTGCAFYRCGGGVEEGAQFSCQRNVPSEAYKSCNGKGGEMIVKNDAQGCIVFSQCVAPGDENNIYVTPVDEVPETTTLLSLAFKLEKLKIELEKLAGESDEIAKYYASTESLDEERYTRVSGMFTSAAEKVDEIKGKLRDNAESISKDDLAEIKHDIKYIKEVVLKDILYMMLSDSDDVRETLESSRKISGITLSATELESNVKRCGTDGSCFDRAIRSCKPVSFQPEGRNGPSITIKGLEDGKCVLHFIMQSDNMVPPGYTKENFYMDCKIQNYALGVKGPEDIIPNCEGPMSSFAKRLGGASELSGSGDAFQKILETEGGPGGCKTEKECANFCIDYYDKCKDWVKDHPAVGTIPSMAELRQIASGEFEERGRSASQFSGPGGCKGPEECDKFCRSNPDECLKWCDENPDSCPKQPLSVPRQISIEQTTSQPPKSVQACVGCLNNGICDIGECSECVDCLRGERSITGEIVRWGA
ncbi:MAG: hypothetical protein HYT70_00010 [Candidatus Aenigmarchaeota archaeon]|nr:hypothetical protein [Candidatus Aenigmarchaeota archaeon]